MRRIQFYGAMSLDGYLATSDDDLQWLFDTVGGEQANTAEFLAQVDTSIMGRHTYEATKKLLGTEPLYPEFKNIVLSSSRTVATRDASFADQDVVFLIEELKKQSGKNIWIVGGGKIVTDLIKADLIDDWWIQIAPVLLGQGKRLFPTGDYASRYELVGMKQFNQLAEVRYQRIKSD